MTQVKKQNIVVNNISGHGSIKDCVHEHLQRFFNTHSSDAAPSNVYEYIINEVERALIIETMQYANNVKAQATKILGINRNTLSKKMKQYSLD